VRMTSHVPRGRIPPRGDIDRQIMFR
jgi:hypothetical protein